LRRKYGNKTKWHISSEPGAKSDELREDRSWEIEDADKRSRIAAFKQRTGGLVYG
jgi:hypothetical protein